MQVDRREFMGLARRVSVGTALAPSLGTLAQFVPTVGLREQDWKDMSKGEFLAEYYNRLDAKKRVVLSPASNLSLENSLDYELPLHRFDVRGTERVNSNDRQDVRDVIGKRFGQPEYNSGGDIGAHGLGQGNRAVERSSLRAIEKRLAEHENRVLVTEKRPVLHSPAYYWHRHNRKDRINPSWQNSQSLPFGGQYDSRDLQVNEHQRALAHTVGIDVFAVSTYNVKDFKKGHQKMNDFLRDNSEFYWLYEITDELPMEFEDGLPIINFDNPEVRSKFVDDMVRYANFFDESNYHVLDDEYYPVWMWLTHIIRGDFTSAVSDARERVREEHGKELALIGGEQMQFPNEDDATIKRLRNFYAVTGYGHYTPMHTEMFGGELSNAYTNLTIGNMVQWIDMAQEINTAYRRKILDVWPVAQLGYEDNRGNPVLDSNQNQIRYFLEQFEQNLIRRFGIDNAMFVSFNEHYEGHGLEPTRGRRKPNGRFDMSLPGYNNGYLWAREFLRVFGPTYFYRQNWDRINEHLKAA